MFGVGLTGLLGNPAPSQGVGVAPWDGHAFTASQGVGIKVLDGYSTQTTSAWDTAMTSTRLNALVTAGFDYVRPIFGIEAAMGADAAALDALWVIAAHAIDALVAKNLKVVFCLYPRLDGTGSYPASAIETDYPSGAKWLRLLDVVKYFARKIGANYTNQQVAFEQYNEMTVGLVSGQSAMAKAVWNAIRTINRNTTVLVSGADYATLAGAVELMNGQTFDANTGIAMHNYNPAVFAAQNAGVNSAVHSLHYPPIASDRTAAIAAAPTAADLPNYFDVPYDKTYLSGLLADVETARISNSIAASRIFVTEYGNVGDYPGSAGDGGRKVARAKWYQDVSGLHAAKGYAQSIWVFASPDPNDFTSSYTLDDQFMVASGRVPSTSYETEATALFARLTTSATTARKGLMNAVVKMLKDAGIWSISDAIYFLGAHDAQAAQRNWKADAYNLTPSGTLTFTADQGYKGNGSSGFLSTGLYPGIGGSNYVQNSATLAVSVRTAGTQELQFSDQAGKNGIGFGSGGGYTREIVASSGGSEAFPGGPASATGLLLVTRNSSSQIIDYINGSKGTTSSQTSAALNPGGAETWNVLELLRSFGSTYSSAEVDFALIASGMTATQAKDLWTIQQFYKDGMARAA